MSDPRALLVMDTSVVINLNATACAADIVSVLPYDVVVVDVVQGELQEDRRTSREDAVLLAALVESQHIRIVTLNEPALHLFGELVAGPASDTLDDGEAATIAYAISHHAVPAIDERKARRICVQRFGMLQLLSTVDIFADATVEAALGRAKLSNAVFNALRDARMRVLPERLAWVVALIGTERAAQCPSLPRQMRPG